MKPVFSTRTLTLMSAGIAINDAAPLSIAALCDSVRGSRRAK